jgi:acetyl-CoA C-acetyltransferase
LKPGVMYIGNMLAVSLSRQANLGALLTEDVGLVGTEGVTVEAADASGGAALRMAYTWRSYPGMWMQPWWWAWRSTPM